MASPSPIAMLPPSEPGPPSAQTPGPGSADFTSPRRNRPINQAYHVVRQLGGPSLHRPRRRGCACPRLFIIYSFYYWVAPKPSVLTYIRKFSDAICSSLRAGYTGKSDLGHAITRYGLRCVIGRCSVVTLGEHMWKDLEEASLRHEKRGSVNTTLTYFSGVNTGCRYLKLLGASPLLSLKHSSYANWHSPHPSPPPPRRCPFPQCLRRCDPSHFPRAGQVTRQASAMSHFWRMMVA